MKNRLRLLLLFIIPLAFISCASGGSEDNTGEAKDRKLESGKVNKDVSCFRDQEITYTLYLPKNYVETREYPLILVFDPHGSGELPLEMYKNLAEKYGCIMMGSNDSKNGNSISETSRIINALFNETGRFSVDTNRIYAMGFSGGARIASIIGLFHGGLAGVIGAGAGFPGTDQPGKFRFDYIGFAGTYDFNMTELIRLDEQLDQQLFDHALFLFDGIHEWPSESMMEKAFEWNECCAMRKNLIPRNEPFINNEKRVFDSALLKDKSGPDKIAYHRTLKNTISFLKGLCEMNVYIKQLSSLETDAGYRHQAAAMKLQMEKEIQEQQRLAEEFFFKDLSWWKNKIGEYNKRITENKSPSDTRMCRRIKSYLSLMAYMNFTRMQSSGDSAKANFAYQVYQVVDPENAAKIKK